MTTTTKRNFKSLEEVRRFWNEISIVVAALIVIVSVLVISKSDLEVHDAEGLAQLNELSFQIIPLEIPTSLTTEEQYHEIRRMYGLEAEETTSESVSVEESYEELYDYSQLDYTDVEYLAQLMYAEEGVFFSWYKDKPEDIEKVLKYAGSVVVNRAEIGYKGENTIAGTIFCNGQYHRNTLNKIKNGQNVPDIVYEWAEDLLNGGTLGPRGMIYQAEFEQGDFTQDHIENQYFCGESKYN